jgi:hypothetical protein
MVRGGYSINYASVPYMSFAQKLAAQPPFAVSNTVIGTAISPVLIANAFSGVVNGLANNYAVDPNYQLGYVHIWNIDVQRELGRTLSIGAAYTGTRGQQLDLLRAPNRDPSGGLRIASVQPFIWQSSGAHSIMNALSLRMQRRLAQGISGGVTYTYAKAMDNASSLGGGGGVVAQNDQNLGAEWGPSSFDVRHRLTANYSYEIPLGQGRRWLTSSKGVLNVMFGGWVFNGTYSMGTGSPFTPRVSNAKSDVSSGVNGTLRADYNGQPIALANPTLGEWFNIAAFSVPASGAFGTAGRNIIYGPGSGSMNMALQKSFTFRGRTGMSLRIQANNVLNQVQFSSIDSIVNSPTFGRVTGVRPMRSAQIIARINF